MPEISRFFKNLMRKTGKAYKTISYRLPAIMREVNDRDLTKSLSCDTEILLEKTFAGLIDAVFVISSSSRTISMCNSAVEKIFGYRPQEIIDRNTAFLHVDETGYDTFGKEVAAALAADGVYRTQFQMRRKNGEVFSSEHCVSQIRDESERLIATVSVVRDLTRQKQVEHALRESEARYRTLFEHSPDAVIIIDPQTTRILECNDLVAGLLGYPLCSYTTLCFCDLEAVESKSQINARISKITSTGRDEFETKLIKQDGTLIDVLTVVRIVQVAGQTVLYSVLRDITRDKRLQRSLRESKELFELAIEGSNSGIWDLKLPVEFPAGHLGDEIYLSRRLKAMVGYSDEDFPGSLDAWQQLIVPEDLKNFRQCLEDHAVNKIEHFETQYRIRHRDGTVRWMHTRGRIQRNEAGAPVRCIGIDSNITEQKKMQQSLQLSEEKYRLLYETMLQGVIYFDAQGTMLAANPAAENILGLPREEIESRTLFDLRWQAIDEDGAKMPPESFPSWLASTTGLAQEEVIMGVYNPICRQYRWISVNAVPLISADPCQKVKVHTTFIDITARRNAEAGLMEYSNRLEVLHEIDSAVLEERDFSVLIGTVLPRLRSLLPCERASIVGFDSEGGSAEVLAVQIDGETVLDVGARVSLDLFGSLEDLARGKIHSIDDISRNEQSSPELKQLQEEGIRVYINVPMICRGKLVGSLNLGSTTPDYFTPRHNQIAREVADSLAVALQNSRLIEAITRHRHDLQKLSSHIINTQEDERKRISRELHDEIGQKLTAISINLSLIEKDCSTAMILDTRKKVVDARHLVEEITDQVHDISLFLRPSLIDDLGLVPALRWFTQRYAQRAAIEVILQHDGLDERLPLDVETTVYRIIQEALNNVLRHAGAGRVHIQLERERTSLFVRIADNGKGFVVEKENIAGSTDRFRLGLLGMQERVLMLDGRLRIQSQPEQGTELCIQIPLRGIYGENSSADGGRSHPRSQRFVCTPSG